MCYRATISNTSVKPIDTNVHKLNVKRTAGWVKACQELKTHQERLERFLQQQANRKNVESDEEDLPSDVDEEDGDEVKDETAGAAGDVDEMVEVSGSREARGSLSNTVRQSNARSGLLSLEGIKHVPYCAKVSGTGIFLA